MVAENLCSFCGDLGNLSAIMPQYSLGRTERSAVRQSWKRFCGQWKGTSHGWARMFLGVRRSIIRFSLASGRRRCSFRKPSGTHPSLNQCAEPLLQRSQEDLRQGDQIKGAIMKHPSTCLVDSTKLPYPCLDHRADTQISEPEGYQLTCRVRGYFQTE